MADTAESESTPFTPVARAGDIPAGEGRTYEVAGRLVAVFFDGAEYHAIDDLEAIRLLRPRVAFPSHYGTWPPIEQDAAAWARRVRDAGVAEVHVPAPGQPVRVA